MCCESFMMPPRPIKKLTVCTALLKLALVFVHKRRKHFVINKSPLVVALLRRNIFEMQTSSLWGKVACLKINHVEKFLLLLVGESTKLA